VVTDRLRDFFSDERAILDLAPDGDASVLTERIRTARGLADRLTSKAAGARRKALLAIVERIWLHEQGIGIRVRPQVLGIHQPSDILLDAPAVKVRAGRETKMVIASREDTETSRLDPKLVGLMVDAHRVQKQLLDGISVAEVAGREGISRAWAGRLARLSWLAPDIVEGILAGTQPPSLTRRTLLAAAGIPLEWDGQRRMFGWTASCS